MKLTELACPACGREASMLLSGKLTVTHEMEVDYVFEKGRWIEDGRVSQGADEHKKEGLHCRHCLFWTGRNAGLKELNEEGKKGKNPQEALRSLYEKELEKAGAKSAPQRKSSWS